MIVLVLTTFNSDYITIIKTDLSDQYIKKVLLQKNNKRIMLLYAYFFKKNNLVEYNYKIYNKKILAII